MCNHGRVNECLEIDHINNSYIDVRAEIRVLVVARQSAASFRIANPSTSGLDKTAPLVMSEARERNKQPSE